MGVLKELERQVLHALLSGYTVRLGSLGSFRLTAKSVGVEIKDDVSSALVQKARVRYVPSTWINNKLLLQNVEFKNVYKANKKKTDKTPQA